MELVGVAMTAEYEHNGVGCVVGFLVAAHDRENSIAKGGPNNDSEGHSKYWGLATIRIGD